MEDYPSMMWPLVARETKIFEVKINPCLVTDLEIGSFFSKVKYIVGNVRTPKAFSFVQEPCSYEGTYTMTYKNGGTKPDFMTQLDRFEMYDIYTTNEDHVGNYTLEVVVVLDNLALFAALDPIMDDYISDISNPPSSLIYTAKFDFELEVLPPDSDYEEADNTPPYLFPPPENFYIEVGTKLKFFVGDSMDNEAANQTFRVDAEFSLAAHRFM